MTDHTDLIAKLRNYMNERATFALRLSAADALEAQGREIVAIKASCSQAAKDAVLFQDERNALSARLDEAEALLREARNDVVEAMNRTHKPHTMTFYRDQLANIDAFLGRGTHVHTDECWEPDSGCDMGRNEKYVKAVEP